MILPARRRCLLLALVYPLLTSSVSADGVATIDIDIDQAKVELSPVLYGLFFEDINFAADGGLYAELVQNRSFEYFPVGGTGSEGSKMHPLFAWEKVERDGGRAKLGVVDDEPLNANNPNYLAIELGGSGVAGVRNHGFDGIVVERGAKFDFSVYARGDGDKGGPLVVSLETPEGEVLASGEIENVSSEWTKHELTLVAEASAEDATLTLTTASDGRLAVDMVSLFPRDTFKGRKNGLRKDLAQALADLHPTFLRFPGGCLVHGQGLANAYRWKDTVGDVAERKPNWNLLGYHQTYGLGYFEYMQFCEDIGATPLPVVPVGAACGFRKPFDFASLDELDEWVEDALDLIEFANGPVTSRWGKVRAEMGHPEPFGLEYLCLGNEEHDTPEVRERIPHFVQALREAHPEVKLIGTSGLGPGIPLYDLMSELRVYSSDEHYYMAPDWYLKNADRFDGFDRDLPKIFVGEYASEGNAQRNAVAEAAFLTGVERNGDIVDMTCYAPLFAKYGHTQWNRANLIWFDNKELVRTPNYWVQQLFAKNRGDIFCDTRVTVDPGDWRGESFAGRVGIGTWRTTIEVERATLDGEPLELGSWDTDGGAFSASDGRLTQRDVDAQGCVALTPIASTGPNAVFEVRARKTGGNEGFLVVFGANGEGRRCWWNVGGWRNTRHAVEKHASRNSVERLAESKGTVEAGRWYDLRVEIAPGSIRCFLDGRLVHAYRQPAPELYVSSTLDNESGELAVKIVNPAEHPLAATLNLRGGGELSSEATLTTLSGPARAENFISEARIEPRVSTLSADETMQLRLPPMSVQVLRLGVR